EQAYHLVGNCFRLCSIGDGYLSRDLHGERSELWNFIGRLHHWLGHADDRRRAPDSSRACQPSATAARSAAAAPATRRTPERRSAVALVIRGGIVAEAEGGR